MSEPNQFQFKCPKHKVLIGAEEQCPLCHLDKIGVIPPKEFYKHIFGESKTIYSPKQLALIKKKLPHLTSKEAKIMKLRIGSKWQSPKSLRFVGKKMGLSQEM